MNDKVILKIKIGLALLGAVFVGLVIWQLSAQTQFRVTNVTPKKTLPTSASVITVEFNKELVPTEEQPPGYLRLDPGLNLDIKIDGKILNITLIDTPARDTKLNVGLDSITAVNGETLTSNIAYDVKYVPFSSLSESERARQAELTRRPADDHPLLRNLPHDEIAFRIDYLPNENFGTARSWQEEKENFVVFVNTFTVQDGVPLEIYAQKNRELRESALSWIRERGIDPERDITIVYNPSDELLNGEEEFTGDGAEPNIDDFQINTPGSQTEEPFLEDISNDENPVAP